MRLSWRQRKILPKSLLGGICHKSNHEQYRVSTFWLRSSALSHVLVRSPGRAPFFYFFTTTQRKRFVGTFLSPFRRACPVTTLFLTTRLFPGEDSREINVISIARALGEKKGVFLAFNLDSAARLMIHGPQNRKLSKRPLAE